MSASFRASRHLVIYRGEGRLFGHNYVSRFTVTLTPDVVALLASLTSWRSERELADLSPAFGETASLLMPVLVAATLVDEREGTPPVGDPDRLSSWGLWNPIAAVLHFSTRNGIFPRDPEWQSPTPYLGGVPMPEPCKQYDVHSRIPLTSEIPLGSLTAALESRRTHRAFGRDPIAAEQLSTLLRLTFGVRHWGDTTIGPAALKTSPSGGARHPTEAYVAVRAVEGIPPGLYHFDARRHDLALLREGLDREDISRYVVGQAHFVDAAAIVLMTTVFARTMWKYPSPRAYRTVLIELGHLAQTFCLIATALGLAPFTTMALSESAIESDLGLDGIDESAMYIVGVGTRP